MEGLQDKMPLPEPEIVRRSITSHNADSAVISFSLIAEDADLDELNTVNETVIDDYSQASTAIATDSSLDLENSRVITRILESPPPENAIVSQMDVLPDSVSLGRPEPTTPSLDLMDDDILPPSPDATRLRTPSNVSRSSAFVAMATGSPVQGSLRTLRNIEMSEAQTSTLGNCVSIEEETFFEKEVVLNSGKETNISSKAMRQIHFESDSSNHSVTESPSSFVPEPGKVMDSSIPKPIVSRLVDFNKDDDGIEIVKVVEQSWNPTTSQDPNSQTCEADSATQDLIPRLTSSNPENSEIQNVGNNPLANSDSQTPNVVNCFETQDLLKHNFSNMENEKEIHCSLTSKLELILDPQHYTNKVEHTSTPNEAALGLSVNEIGITNQSDKEHKRSNEVIDTISSVETTPEISKEECMIFEGIFKIYDPVEGVWILLTTRKDVPMSKRESLLEGSPSDFLGMGLLDRMDSSVQSISKLESPADFMSVGRSSSGYHADVSECSKSEAMSKSSRLSVMSTFEAGHLGVTSLISRPSFDISSIVDGEFVVPKHPVRHKRSSSIGHGKAHSTVTGESPTESSVEHVASSPKSTPPPTGKVSNSTMDSNLAGDVPVESVTTEVSDLKQRKRGRKTKVPDTIQENSETGLTPVKKGRKARSTKNQPVEGTPGKSSKKAKSTAEEQGDNSNPQPGTSEQESVSKIEEIKSSDEWLKEAEMDWRDIRKRNFEPDMPVFAQWTDKCYYAARLVQRDATHVNKWSVKFEDGQARNLSEEFILPIQLLRKRQSVLVLNESLGEGRPAIVVGHQMVNTQVEYIVEVDNGGTLAVPRKRVCMTQDQVRQWHETIVVPQLFSPQTFSVSLDNIVSGKRRRITHMEPSASAATTPRTPHTPKSKTEETAASGGQTPRSSRSSRMGGATRKKTRVKRDILLDSSTLSESSGSLLSQKEEEIRSRILTRLLPIPSSEIGELEHPETKKTAIPDEKVMGPLPSNEQLFKGFAFILTFTAKELDINPEHLTDELEQYIDDIPFSKEYITTQIKAGGGVVLDRFDHIYYDTDDTILVISNRPCRTERYIRSLSAHIRGVSHHWVQQCCRTNTLLPWKPYFLPAGIDLDGNVIEWNTTTGRSLSGLRILLVGPECFLNLWQPILVQAQCVIVFRFTPTNMTGDPETVQDQQDQPADFVVATKDCPIKVVNQANRMNIPIVSTEWIIQSLIQGKQLDPKARREFDFNYSPTT